MPGVVLCLPGDLWSHLQETWRAQEEEVTRLMDEVDALQRRRQELQEALAAAPAGTARPQKLPGRKTMHMPACTPEALMNVP